MGPFLLSADPVDPNPQLRTDGNEDAENAYRFLIGVGGGGGTAPL